MSILLACFRNLFSALPLVLIVYTPHPPHYQTHTPSVIYSPPFYTLASGIPGPRLELRCTRSIWGILPCRTLASETSKEKPSLPHSLGFAWVRLAEALAAEASRIALRKDLTLSSTSEGVYDIWIFTVSKNRTMGRGGYSLWRWVP